MEYIIGIESGGTKSELAAYDLKDNLIYRKSGGFGNPSVDIKKTIDNINCMIETCIKELEAHKCVFIAIGMAGADTGDFKEIMGNHIKNNFKIDNVILNDAEMTAKSFLNNDDGLVIIAGTGASVYVQKCGIGKVIGGWGHILGDKGSGYHTVIEAFRRITWQIDNSMSLDRLSTELIKEIMGKQSVSANDMNVISKILKKFIYDNPKKVVAALFPLIVKLSDEGDEASTKLLENAGRYLAETVITALKELDENKNIIVGLQGGVLYNSKVVLESFEKEVTDYNKNCQFIGKDKSVTEAALNIYKVRR